MSGLVGAAVLVWTVGASCASASASVEGGAFALKANLDAVAVPLSVGALPSVTLPVDGGGPYRESLLSANGVGLAPVDVATVSTEGNTGIGRVRSSASLLGFDVGGLVSVATVTSRCSATFDGATGSATVAGLVIAGITIDSVDAGPNTRISLPFGSVTVNEQRPSLRGGLTVDAVHVTLDSGLVVGDIVIGQSRCSASSTRARGLALRRARRGAR